MPHEPYGYEKGGYGALSVPPLGVVLMKP